MDSIFLKSTIALLFIVSVLSCSTAQILDIDGLPLINGGAYYIVPQDINVNGGLSPVSKSPCPYYISLDKDETSPGIPVKISSPAKIGVILEGLPITITFLIAGPKLCSLKWKVDTDEKTGQSLVTLAGPGSPSFDPSEYFAIEGDWVYTIKSLAKGKNIGISENDGLLAITYKIPLPIKFRKAFGNNVLAMKV